jgi:hypothetical protein
VRKSIGIREKGWKREKKIEGGNTKKNRKFMAKEMERDRDFFWEGVRENLMKSGRKID